MTTIGIAVVAIAVAIGIAGVSFWAGFALAGILGLGAEADRQMEAMRRKHRDNVTAWLNDKCDEMR